MFKFKTNFGDFRELFREGWFEMQLSCFVSMWKFKTRPNFIAFLENLANLSFTKMRSNIRRFPKIASVRKTEIPFFNM